MKNDIIKFLLGEESFDGYWFGEKHPIEQGAFWWRKHLRQFINENQALRIHDVVGRSEQFTCKHCGTYEKHWNRKNDDWYCKTCGHICR